MMSLDSVLSYISPQQLAAAACWHVVNSRQTAQYTNVLEFLETLHAAAPDLVAYRHYARLMLGFKALIILDMIRQNQRRAHIRSLFDTFFQDASPVTHHHATSRDISKISQAEEHFRNMVQRLLTDSRFRQQYVETELEEEYGEAFMVALEKLLREYFVRLESTLPRPRIEELQESMKPVGRMLRPRQNDPPAQLDILLRYFADMGWPPCDRGPSRAKVDPPRASCIPPRKSCPSDPTPSESSGGAASRRSEGSAHTLPPKPGGEGETSGSRSRREPHDRQRKMDSSCSDSDQEVLLSAYKMLDFSWGEQSATVGSPRPNPLRLSLTTYQIHPNPERYSLIPYPVHANVQRSSLTLCPIRPKAERCSRVLCPVRPNAERYSLAPFPVHPNPAKLSPEQQRAVQNQETVPCYLRGLSASKTVSRTPGGSQSKTSMKVHKLFSVTPAGSPQKTVCVTPAGSPQKTVCVTPAGSPQKTVCVTPAGSPQKTVCVTPAGSPQKTVCVTPAGSPQKTVCVTPAGSPQKTVCVTPGCAKAKPFSLTPRDSQAKRVSLAPEGSRQKTLSRTSGGFWPDAKEGSLRVGKQNTDCRQSPSPFNQLRTQGASPRRVLPVLAAQVDEAARSPALGRPALLSPLLKRRRLFRAEEVVGLISETLEDEEVRLHEAGELEEGLRDEHPRESSEQWKGELVVRLSPLDVHIDQGPWVIESGVPRHDRADYKGGNKRFFPGSDIRIIPAGSRKRALSPDPEPLISPELQLSPGCSARSFGQVRTLEANGPYSSAASSTAEVEGQSPSVADTHGTESGRLAWSAAETSVQEAVRKIISMLSSQEIEASANPKENTLLLPSILQCAEVTPQKRSSCGPSPGSSSSSVLLFQTPPEPSADVIQDSEDESSGSSKVSLWNYQRTKFNTFIPTFREHFRAGPRGPHSSRWRP